MLTPRRHFGGPQDCLLLVEIEREKVPDRLVKLAVELQKALLEKRRGGAKN